MAFVPVLPARRIQWRAPGVPHGVSTRRAMRCATRTTRMLVLEAGSTTEMDKILNMAEESLVVVDYSTTWCGPCKKVAPVFEKISEQYTDVVFVKVMGDVTPESSELMKREGIRAVPAFHFWKNKKKVLDFTGSRMEDVQQNIESLK